MPAVTWAPRRAVAAVAWFAVASASAAAACNLITGEHDRYVALDNAGHPLDAAPAPTSTISPDATAGPGDAAVADGAFSVVWAGPWASPNHAGWLTDGSTTRITTSSAQHAVIVPDPQQELPGPDYTVTARVHAFGPGEYGVLARVQPDGGAAELFGSEHGQQSSTFLGSFSAPDWNPSVDSTGPFYDASGEHDFVMVLTVVGSMGYAKMWDANDGEPDASQIQVSMPWSTGTGVGFYSYVGAKVDLVDLRITVP